MIRLQVPRVYVETSIWNFAFAGDAPEHREATLAFFEKVRAGEFEVFISNIVLAEINNAPEAKRAELLALVNEISPSILPTSEEASALTEELIHGGAVSAKHGNDAAHIAIAVVENMDVLLSWNFRHIVRTKTRVLTTAASRIAGYKEIQIASPEEVIHEDED